MKKSSTAKPAVAHSGTSANAMPEESQKGRQNKSKSKAAANDPSFLVKQNQALLEAADLGDFNKLKAAIRNDCDVNAQDENGDTALHILSRLAPYNDCLKCINAILESKANPDIQNRYGNTPLHCVCGYADSDDYSEEEKERDDETVRLLLAAKANPNLQNSNGDTPLCYASSQWQNDEIKINLLLAAGANPNLPINNPPLFWAVNSPWADFSILALINGGADVTATDNNGNSLLHCASSPLGQNNFNEDFGEEDCEDRAWDVLQGIFELLLRAGADPYVRNRNGELAEDANEDERAREYLRDYRLAYEKNALNAVADDVAKIPNAGNPGDKRRI